MYLFEFHYARRSEVLLHSRSNKVKESPLIDGRLYLKTKLSTAFTYRVSNVHVPDVQ